MVRCKFFFCTCYFKQQVFTSLKGVTFTLTTLILNIKKYGQSETLTGHNSKMKSNMEQKAGDFDRNPVLAVHYSIHFSGT